MTAASLGLMLGFLLFFAPNALAQVTVSYMFEGVNRPIPDNNPNGLTDLRSVVAPEPGLMMVDVNVQLTLSGTSAHNGDLYATLQHGDGFSVLLNRPGKTAENPLGYGDNGLDVQLDDAAPNGNIHSYRSTLFGNDFTPLGSSLRSVDTGAWSPDGREIDPGLVSESDMPSAGLSSFNGIAPEGEWQLFVADLAQAGAALLENWGLEFTLVPASSAINLSFKNAIVQASGGDRLLQNPIELGGAVQIKGDAELTLSGPLTGTGELIKRGSGRVILQGANTFSGGITLGDGVLALANDRALGLGGLTLNGGSLETTGGPRSLSNPVQLSGDVVIAGAHALELAGQATVIGSRQLSVMNQLTFSGDIADGALPGGLTKSGGGILRLTGANTFSGGVTLSDGELRVDNSSGSGTGSGPVQVGQGGKLSGNGRIDGLVSIDGRYSPGNSPGLMQTGSQLWNSGGIYEWEINAANGSAGMNPGWDLAQVNGSLTLAATTENPFQFKVISLTLADIPGSAAGFDPNQSYQWKVLTASDGIVGFNLANLELDLAGFSNPYTGTFQINPSGNDLFLSYTAVPEPETWALILGSGLSAWALLRRRRRSAAN